MKKLILSAIIACFFASAANALKLCVGTPWIKEIKISGTQSVTRTSYQDWTATVTSDYANSNKAITWSVYSGGSYASITSPTNTSARINGNAVGTATIRATAQDGSGIYGERTITVNPILVSSISVSCDPNPVNVNTTSSCTANVQPTNADNKNVTWTNGPSFSSGSAGTYTVTATAQDGSGKSGSTTVTVNNPFTVHSNLTGVCSASTSYFPYAGCGSIYSASGNNWVRFDCALSGGSGKIYGVATCSSTSGSFGVAGNPTGSGENCWCKLCSNENRNVCGNWVYLSVPFQGCADNCAFGCQLYAGNDIALALCKA